MGSFLRKCLRGRNLALILAVAAIVGAIVAVEVFTGSDKGGVGTLSSGGKRAEGETAPELQGITGWINAEPFTLASLRGKVVLIDFWTYTCVNCVRTLPYLKEWYGKYEDKGLVIVGVHSPEFNFEKKRENVVKAVETHGLKYPVVQDNYFQTWRAYSNRYWPAKYLIDKDGVIRFTHFGEGAYIEMEDKIRELLKETGVSLEEVSSGGGSEPVLDPKAFADQATGQTRELYGGYIRGQTLDGLYIAHQEYYNATNQAIEYTDPGGHRNHLIYLQGLWVNGPESLIHGRVTDGYQDYIAIKFYGTSVNAVIDIPSGVEPFKVVVTLDGKPLPSDHFGADIRLDADERSFFLVDEARMYGVVDSREFDGHELTLSSNSDKFALFAFTFGSYGQGP